jgi:hypothetical protein
MAVDKDFDIHDLDPARMRPNVLEAVHKLKIPKDDLIVVGGAALQIFGIKVSEDIDVVLSPERMERVLHNTENHNSRGRHFGRQGLQVTATWDNRGQRVFDEGYGVVLGAVTYMPAPADSKYSATFEELHDEAVDVEGILVSPPERILAWKQGVHRAKDARDIVLINDFLATQAAIN